MNKTELLDYLEKIDSYLTSETMLFIYGSAAFMLLDEAGRISLDIDVAAPYSSAKFPELKKAAGKAGLPVNPVETFQGDHIEWISFLRLCLPPPDEKIRFNPLARR